MSESLCALSAWDAVLAELIESMMLEIRATIMVLIIDLWEDKARTIRVPLQQ
jgi:hypothetical protein